jgi:hypothetical protein
VTSTHLCPRAEADLVERTRYYRREGGDELGRRFFDAAVAAPEAIGRMPGAATPRVGELCEMPVRAHVMSGRSLKARMNPELWSDIVGWWRQEGGSGVGLAADFC